MSITESFVPAQRVVIETLIGLGAATLEGIKRLGALNVQSARDIVTEAGRAPQVLLSITSARELMTLNFSLVESRVQRVSAYGFQLQSIASSAGSEVGEVMRAGIAQVQSTILSADKTSTQNAVVDASHANGQDDGQASAQSNEQAARQVPMEATEQPTSGAFFAHKASNGTQKSASRTKSASASGHATNKNSSRARNGSEKSRQRSGGSGSGRTHAS